jgi:protein SCO1/2
MEITEKRFYRKDNFIEKLVLNKYFWIFFTLFMFSYPILRSMNRELPKSLPVMSKVPEFNLQDENGKPFGSKDLHGKVYIANFHFTSCPTVCPKLMTELQKIQKRVRGVGQKIALVSYTVDPENDTSKVLFKHARDLRANPHVWKFLTGDKGSLESLLVSGFKVPMGDKEQTDANMYDIAHTQKLVLVDQAGNIRGYYSIDRVSIDQLMIDVGLLINRENLNFKKSKESEGV